MTLSEELSTVRGLLNEVNKNTTLTDSLIYSLWKKERAIVLSQELKRYNNLPHFLTKRYCIQLEKVNSVDCQCDSLKDMGCYILRSKYNIPKYISGSFKDNIKIYNLGNKQIGLIEPNEYISDMIDPVKSRSMRAMIPSGGKLEIWNSPKNDMGYAYIRMIPADPLEWATIEKCDSTEDNVSCYDPMNEDAGLTEELSQRVYKLILDTFMKTKIRLPEDQSQDLNPNTN